MLLELGVLMYTLGVLFIGFFLGRDYERVASCRYLKGVLAIPRTDTTDPETIPNPAGWEDQPPNLKGDRDASK